MRNSILYILLLSISLLCSGCIGQREQQVQGEFVFADTGLVLQLPENWQAVAIPGANWPLLATEIDYGIRPNIRLVQYSTAAFQAEDIEAFLKKRQAAFADFQVSAKKDFAAAGFLEAQKIQARRKNTDNIPLVHLSYVLVGERGSYILYATCAEPSLARTEPLFDAIVGSAKIDE